MYPDPIVDEIHRFREAYAKKFNFDLEAIVRDLQSRQLAAKRKVLKVPRRRPLTHAVTNDEPATHSGTLTSRDESND